MHGWVGCRAGVDALLTFLLPLGVGTMQNQPAPAHRDAVASAEYGVRSNTVLMGGRGLAELRTSTALFLAGHAAPLLSLAAGRCSLEPKTWITWGPSHSLLKVHLQNAKRGLANSLIAGAKRNRMQQIQHQMQQLFSDISSAIIESRKKQQAVSRKK